MKVTRPMSRAALAIVIISGLIAFRGPLLRSAGRALIVDEPLSPGEVVVVPPWTGAAGALEAADLVQRGMAAQVAVLVDRSTTAQRELHRRGVPDNPLSPAIVLRSLGVDPIREVPSVGNGTTLESQSLAAWCADNRLRSVIIVSTPEHSRRWRRLLRRSMKDGPTRTIVRVTRYADFDPDHWWQSRDGLRAALQEAPKLLLDVVLHPFS
jgi:hypothetical protein